MSMRKTLFSIATALLCFTGCTSVPKTCEQPYEPIQIAVPERPAGQQDAVGLTAPKIDTVRVGFIGVGMRGISAVERWTHIPGVQIKALCDLRPELVEKAQKTLVSSGMPEAATYSGAEDAWKQLCNRDDIDLVYVVTDWKHHAEMGVYAMEHGKHVAIEVPAAMTVEECWKLVDTAEKTRQHCMMLENCCYDPFALTTLNMAQQGVFGEITHVEGAYIHDLRSIYFADESKGGFHNHWGKKYSIEHTGNPYPTHGLGPVCQILNIHRGDRMNYLVSLSSLQAGMTEYARKNFGADSPEARQKYLLGDMNTTLIQTVKGKSIMIQYNVVTPRPYSRLHTVCGTKGFAQKYPVPSIALEPDAGSPLEGKALEEIMERYKHPFTATFGTEAHRRNLPNEMNYVMDCRLIYCLRNGLPLDMDVYDAAEWSCITELSEQSVLNGSIPVEIPDFTRGAWKKCHISRTSDLY